MLAAVNVAAGKVIARALGATDPNAWVAFATQAQWENGGAVRGNNPLNLTDPGQRMYWRPYGQTGWYAGGTAAEWHTDFAAFGSAEGGARAAAANYLGQGSYGAVLAACRAGDGPIPIAQAIQSSPWSSGHYGGKLAARVSAELAALFAASAAAKLPPQEVPPVSEQITTTFSPPRRGTVPDGTRRFAATPPYAELDPLPADGYLFDALVLLDQDSPVRRGTFARTTTTPPVLVIGRQVSFDPMPDTVVSDPTPAAVKLTPAAAPTWPAVPAAQVLPYLVDAFVAGNPDLDPALAARIAQALGQAGASAQSLAGMRGLRLSTVIPGLVVIGELPVYETEVVAEGTVIADAGLGPGGYGVYVQGAFTAPTEGGHDSAAMSEMQTDSGPVTITVIEPGTDIQIGPVGSSVL